MCASSIRCINFLYFVGFLFLIVKSGITTAQVSKVNQTKVVQSEIESFATKKHGFESTTVGKIQTTTVKPSATIESNVTQVFEATTSTYLASTTIESLTTYEDDYYDENITEVSSTTEANKIENATTIPTLNHTQAPESTTEVTVITTIASTTETTTIHENSTTTTIAPNPKNESEPGSNATDSNGILNAQIVTDLYIYYKMITPIVLRIIFGISVSVTKVKAALKKPTGIAISLFCNFFYMPLVS